MNTLAERMKDYERVSKISLMKRMPVIIRIDGCHFHTFTRGFNKPFDEVMAKAMWKTTVSLCQKIQGCVMGYTQSDEISLVLCDYQTYETEGWYNYQVQKICSVAASLATLYFNKYFEELAMFNCYDFSDEQRYMTAEGASFDARCFNLSKEEVCNYLIWRQQDATRNSIQAMAQSLYSQKEIQGLSCNALQNKMLTEKNVNWNNLCVCLKRGAAVTKVNGVWTVDLSTPIFSENRNYIEEKINFE